jgi:hypothetical protein
MVASSTIFLHFASLIPKRSKDSLAVSMEIVMSDLTFLVMIIDPTNPIVIPP